MKTIFKYLKLLIYLLIAALNLNLLLKPLNLVTGGTQGVALLLNHVLKIETSTIIFFINIIALIISYFLLPKENTKSALLSTFAYPFFVKTTSFLPKIPLNLNIIFLLAILSGLIYGFSCGSIYRLGFSSGGLSTINLLIQKYLNFKVSFSNFILNSLIIICGCFFFGLKKAFYSIIVITIGSLIIYLILKKQNHHNVKN